MAKEEKTVYKAIPSSEKSIGVTCITESGVKYRITTHKIQNKHTLWKCREDDIEKIATSDSPYDLYELIDWRDSR